MVRSIPAFLADDGSIHRTEREALMASVAAVLGGDHVGAERIAANLRELLPLLNKLSDPRNAAPLRRHVRPDHEPGLTPENIDALAHAGEDVTDVPALKKLMPEIEWNDLRLGQMVDFDDYLETGQERTATTGTIILLDGPGNEVEPGWVHVSTEGGTIIAPLPCIKLIRAQPEQLLPLDEARSLLAELEALPVDLTTSEGRFNHTRRVMVSARVAELERAEDDQLEG